MYLREGATTRNRRKEPGGPRVGEGSEQKSLYLAPCAHYLHRAGPQLRRAVRLGRAPGSWALWWGLWWAGMWPRE